MIISDVKRNRHAKERCFTLTKKNATGLVLLEVVIDGVLQLPELLLLLHFFLLLVSGQSWFHVVLFIVVVLLFLQRQKGQREE